jgi:hypothetical protein
MVGDKAANISADHPNRQSATRCWPTLLARATMSSQVDCSLSLTDVSRSGKVATQQELNFMLSVVAGISPRDETEALLAAQMAAIHNATMVAARRLNHVETIPQQDSASIMLNKLARTFATQVEALKKYRSAGEQTIKVQHVTVNDGGQAIVGNLSQGGGGTAKTGAQPHEPCASHECGPSLLGHEQALPLPMPRPGGSGLDGMSVPRRQGRSPQG